MQLMYKLLWRKPLVCEFTEESVAADVKTISTTLREMLCSTLSLEVSSKKPLGSEVEKGRGGNQSTLESVEGGPSRSQAQSSGMIISIFNSTFFHLFGATLLLIK
jgi:hypothetical protein